MLPRGVLADLAAKSRPIEEEWDIIKVHVRVRLASFDNRVNLRQTTGMKSNMDALNLTDTQEQPHYSKEA